MAVNSTRRPKTFLNFALYDEPFEDLSRPAELCISSALPGTLLLRPSVLPEDAGCDILLSVGVHGNETAPMEVVDSIVNDILAGHLPLRHNVLIVLGNPPAACQGKRFVDYDLNRLFDGAHHSHSTTAEAKRVAALEALVATFFSKNARPRIHLDLHTALRGSIYERFAIYPHAHGKALSRRWLAWLKAAGIDAALVHRSPTHTFTFFSSERFGADSFSLELGKARPFGENDLRRFHLIDGALRKLLSGATLMTTPSSDAPLPALFHAKYELIKRSEEFRLHLDDEVENFTPLPAGYLIAADGDVHYVAEGGRERILFPNPKVKTGLRAGIVIEPIQLED